MTDRFSSYNWIKTTFRQFCWAHLKRNMQKNQSVVASQEKLVMKYWSILDECIAYGIATNMGEISRKAFKSAMISIQRNIERLLLEGTICGHKKTENSCTLIFKHKELLRTVVETEGVEPANNLAKQLIRFYILWRKNSFGTWLERGNLFVERMMTTTCKLQSRNRYDYTTAIVVAYLKGKPIPSLLPAEEKTGYLNFAA